MKRDGKRAKVPKRANNPFCIKTEKDKKRRS